MKYLLLILLLAGCQQSPSDEGNFPYSHKIVVIDRCEYIIYDGSYSGNIIHKANCKNH